MTEKETLTVHLHKHPVRCWNSAMQFAAKLCREMSRKGGIVRPCCSDKLEILEERFLKERFEFTEKDKQYEAEILKNAGK